MERASTGNRTAHKARFAVFVSGFGRGAIEIIKDHAEGRILPTLGLILSTNTESKALEWAKQHEIPTAVVLRKGKKRRSYETEVVNVLRENTIDYVFLAGYAPIVGQTLLTGYPDRILNVHPSLLPAFKGIHAIDQAMEYGVKVTGVTVHVVNEFIDSGRIIGQEAVRIESGDTFEDLDRKIFGKGVALTRDCINAYFTSQWLCLPGTECPGKT